MRNTFIISIALLFAFSFQLNAQHPIFKTYTVQDGLVANNIRRFYQDSRGFMWIATWEGISKYDGHKFTNFTTANGLSHSLANNFFEADNKLFVALNNDRMDVIENDQVKKFFFSDTPAVGYNFLHLKNRKIALTNHGLFEYASKKFHRPAQDAELTGWDELVELNDTMWAGYDYSQKQIDLFSNNYRLIGSDLFPFFINSIYTDSKKRIWVCTTSGLKLLDSYGKPGAFQLLPLPAAFDIPFLKDEWLNDILEDRNGEYWIGTHKGLVRIFKEGGHVIYTEKDGLPSDAIQENSIFQDRENNIWVGTSKGIVKIVLQNNIRNFKRPDAPNVNHINSIAHDGRNGFLIATANSIQGFDEHNGRFIPISQKNEGSSSIVIPGSKRLIVYHNNVLYNFDHVSGRLSPIDSFFLPLYYFASCSDSSGNFFLGFDGGLAILHKNKLHIDTSITTIKDRISAITIDNNGRLWVGGWGSGLYRIDYSFINEKPVLFIKNFSHLPKDKSIRSLFADKKGNIWVGTRYNGVFCLHPNEKDNYIVTSYDRSNGLSSNFITSFAETNNGGIWIGTHSGLDKLVKEKNRFRAFNFSRLTNFAGSITSILNADNNDWWCIADGELVRFTDHQLENSPPLPVTITSVLLGSSHYTIKVPSDSTATMKYFQNQATFTFSAPGFINEKQVLYSYRMLGSVDTSWTEPKNIHEVSFASLQHGNYTFEVRTIGWNEQPGEIASFHFSITPPFWKTVWFIALCVLALAALFYALYRYRLNQVLKLQRIRNRIATDLHDDIGSTLTNIDVLSELSAKSLQQPVQTAQYLQRISEEVNASGQALDDIIWSVNSKNDSLEEIVIRMRRFAAELFDHTDTKCFLVLSPDDAAIRLSMEQRRDLYLVYKESLNNIYKHAEARHLWVNLGMVNHSVKLCVKDDGKGFDTAAITYRNGLKNLRTRVEKWKGNIQVNSLAGKGTTIEIIIPLKS